MHSSIGSMYGASQRAVYESALVLIISIDRLFRLFNIITVDPHPHQHVVRRIEGGGASSDKALRRPAPFQFFQEVRPASLDFYIDLVAGVSSHFRLACLELL
jgi:hypothetical protein